MDAYTFLNAGITGFFCFSAIHYFINWWHSRSERLLLVFAAQCLFCALLCPCLIAIAHSATVSEAQLALNLRTTFGLMAHAAALTFFGIVGAGRLSKGVSAVILFLTGMAVLNLFSPLRGLVTSLDHVALPGGGTATFPVLGSYSGLVPLIYAGLAGVYAYGLFIASRIWSRDQIGGILIGAAAVTSLLGVVVASLVDIFNYKAVYVGAIPQTIIVLCMAIFLSRVHAARREQLRKSEERLRLALEAGQLGVWEQDPATGAYHGDNRSFDIFKLPLTADRLFPFDAWKSMVDPQDLPRVLESLNAVEKGAKRVTVDYGFSRADGARCHAEIAASAIANEQGQPAGVIGMVWDISERKRATELLEMMKMSIDKHFDAAYWMDANNNFVYVNEAACQDLGYTRDELLGKSVQMVSPRATADILKEIWRELREHGSFTKESEHRRKDGSTFPVEIVATYVRFEGREFNCGFARNIAERRQLEAQRNELAAIVASTDDSIVGQTMGGIVTSWNRGAEKLFGYSAEETIGRSISMLFPPGREHEEMDFLARITRGETIEHFETSRIRKDGRQIVVSLTISPLKDINGNVIGASKIARDITARKQVEERFRLLIEKATDMITVVNRDGINRFVSPSIKQYLGYEPEELLNRSAYEFIEPEDAKRVARAIQKTMSDSAPVTVEYRYRHRDGSWHIIESIGRSIPNQAAEGFIVVNSRDITESRKLAEHVRQAQKMDAIGALAGGVAHDFNNLLTVINGRSELMLMRMGPDAPFRREIRLIQETGERAASLTRQLLAFSRRQVLEPKVVDLNKIVTEMNNMLRRLVPENVSITAVLDPNLRKTKADPGQMEQVLMNLVVNARDAMPSGGRVHIKTANIECDEVFRQQHPAIPLGAYVTMTVSDTGCGMTEHVKAHIFEPFFTTKEQGKGTGLGLPTVFGIVKQSNGHLTLYSEPDKGATFTIYLPQQAGVDDVSAEVQAAVRMGRGETVLVVEDEDHVRALARDVLETLGYKVLEAKNGQEGLALYQQQRENVQLVMTDAIMPKMGGLELAHHLREIDPKVKILLLSGYTDNTLAEDGTLSIAAGFVQKPFTAGALTRKISEILSG